MAYISLASYGALAAPAAPVAGCDPNVLKAMQDKAEAKVAYDTAVTDQIVKEPDSVLAMTCFNQAAGVSADTGGNIFSGDFTAQLTPIVSNALTNVYGNFPDAQGKLDSTVDYSSSATTLTNSFNCNDMNTAWQDSQTKGIHQDVPYTTFSDLVNNAPPAGAGPNFQSEWTASASQSVFSNLQTDMTTLPTPSVTDFSSATSSCDVLLAAGIVPGPCP